MNISDITWSYSLQKVLKNSTTGLITEVVYTFTGTYGDYTSSVRHNKIVLAPTDPTAASFIPIASATEANVTAWIDTAISEAVIFNIEEARVTDIVPWLDENDSKQPKNQDLSGFVHSTPKEQMQQNIKLTIEKQIADATAENVIVEHTF
jgi:hypothetical protein|tara:strand:+ start:603 stop:1052 length:450 start_codon:yes stop_codon:yes gene_type:complete